MGLNMIDPGRRIKMTTGKELIDRKTGEIIEPEPEAKQAWWIGGKQLPWRRAK